MITIARMKCPGCGKTVAFQIDTTKVGQKVNGTCPQCHKSINVNITAQFVQTLEKLAAQKRQVQTPQNDSGTETFVPGMSNSNSKPSTGHVQVQKDATYVPTKNMSNTTKILVLSNRATDLTPQQRFVINQQYTIVGRKNQSGQVNQPDVEVVTQDKFMSKKHCLIRKLENGQFSIEDYNSANGTKLNGKKLETGESIYLMPGDTVTIGHTEFIVSIENEK